MTHSPVSRPGFGLGLRTAHYQDFLTAPQRVDWLEIITDNFLVEGGKPMVMLEKIRRDYPVAMHGVAMSIGSASGLDLNYLARVKTLASRIEPMWVSDHLCWTGYCPNVLHDLYPMPYTEESARLLIAQIRQAQDVLERRLVIENVSSYIRFRSSTVTEWEFLSYVLNEADCDLLLDVNNVYVSSVNHGFSAEAYLAGLPANRVRQMHLAGHSRVDDYIIDTHDHPVSSEVWALYAQACRSFPHVATMIERDDHIPPLGELIDELDHARMIASSNPTKGACTDRPETKKLGKVLFEVGRLELVQRELADYIMRATPPDLPDDVSGSGHLPGERGMHIYRHAYRERLTEVLADHFEKCESYLGTSLFKELAYRYIQTHPPKHRHLGRYGAAFVDLLRSAYPDNRELSDLAQLEWSLREVFDAADVPAWTTADIQEHGVDACLVGSPILHASVRLLSVRSNAVSIWRAIHADEEVPEAVRYEAPHTLAVWRKGLQPHFKSLDAQEAQFLRELGRHGASIAAVAQAWGDSGKLSDPAILGHWLAAWWSDELLQKDAA